MKKILILFIFIFCINTADAVNVKIESLTEVNGNNSATHFAGKILQDTKISDEITLKKDAVINMEIIELVPAKWGKRSAYMIAKPIFMAEKDYFTTLNELPIEAKTTSIKIITKDDIKQNWKKGIKDAGCKAGMKVATNMVPGSGQVLQISKGLIMPEEGKTRLQSATGNLLDTLPTKHLKKGKDLDIKEGDKIVFKFYTKKEKPKGNTKIEKNKTEIPAEDIQDKQ